jgi:hypothetical protein
MQKKEFLARRAKLAKEDNSVGTLTRRYACDLSLKGEVMRKSKRKR